MMALSGVLSSWLIVARKRDLALFAASARRRASSEIAACFLKLRDQAVLFGAIFDHRERGRMQAAGEIDEEDVDADRHRREREIKRIAEREEPPRHRNRHRYCAGEEDARQGRGKRHADREHDHQCREDEDVR